MRAIVFAVLACVACSAPPSQFSVEVTTNGATMRTRARIEIGGERVRLRIAPGAALIRAEAIAVEHAWDGAIELGSAFRARPAELEWIEPPAQAYRVPSIVRADASILWPDPLEIDGEAVDLGREAVARIRTASSTLTFAGGFALARGVRTDDAHEPRVVIAAETSASMLPGDRSVQRDRIAAFLRELQPDTRVTIAGVDAVLMKISVNATLVRANAALAQLDAIHSAGVFDRERMLRELRALAMHAGAQSIELFTKREEETIPAHDSFPPELGVVESWLPLTAGNGETWWIAKQTAGGDDRALSALWTRASALAAHERFEERSPAMNAFRPGGVADTAFIRFGRAAIVGSLRPDDLEKIMRTHSGQLRYCYAKELTRTPGRSMAITDDRIRSSLARSSVRAFGASSFMAMVAELKIAPTGRVDAVAIQNRQDDEAVAFCVRAKLRTFAFPPSKDDDVVVVRQLIMFGEQAPPNAPSAAKDLGAPPNLPREALAWWLVENRLRGGPVSIDAAEVVAGMLIESEQPIHAARILSEARPR